MPEYGIRPEAAGDWDSVRDLLRLAFGGEEEADLVARLRADRDLVAALVANEGSRVVAYIAFSRLSVVSGSRSVAAVSLAPVAVLPDRQRRGIGSALVRAGLEACTSEGAELAVVLGHPAYYPRFGFSPALAENLSAPFSGAAFMALELRPGVLGDLRWTVTYPAAFGLT